MYLGTTKEFVLIFRKTGSGERINLDNELDPGDNAIELQVKAAEGAENPVLIGLDLANGITKRAQVGTDIGVADAVIASSATLPGSSWPASPANKGVFRYDVKCRLLGGRVKVGVPPSDLTVKGLVNE